MPRISQSTRTRRPSAMLHTMLLEAARELFLERGYDGATTKEISERAGVSERVLFNRFGSKAEIFKAAVIAPFAAFISDYIGLWEREANRDHPEAGLEVFVDGLYDLAIRHRAVLLSCVARALAADAGVERELLDEFASTFQRLVPTTGTYAEHHGIHMDNVAVVATSAATVLGTALLDDLLFPRESTRPSRERLINEIKRRLGDSFAPRKYEPSQPGTGSAKIDRGASSAS